MATLSTAGVQPRAQAALAKSPFYELRQLEVVEQEGKLLLSGAVSSFYHKQLAQEVVRSVCQEIEIINCICVQDEAEV